MRLSITFVIALLSLISSSVIARSTRGHNIRAKLQVDSATGTVPYTNAQRFARGLPPISPTRRRGGALRPRTSPGVCSNSDIPRGRIKITTSDGRIRYIQGGWPSTGASDTTDNPSNALQVSLVYQGTSPPAYFRIERADNLSGVPPNLGATLQIAGNNALTTSNGYIALSTMVGTNPGIPNTPAEATKATSTWKGGEYYSESVIWSIGANNVLTMSWVNPGQTTPNALIPVLVGTTNRLVYTPSLSEAQKWLSSYTLFPSTLQFECLA
ncbi:hypothetical protein FRC02_002678 [Tulasnella sp. 418]|nr:hypothetical protein FRC02_002678 [Tulasnella sp. 418]